MNCNKKIILLGKYSEKHFSDSFPNKIFLLKNQSLSKRYIRVKIKKNKNNQNFVILLKKNQNIKCPKKPYFKIKN